MKALYLLVGLTASYAAQAQSSWYDSFSDSTLHQNPAWIGDTSAFTHTINGLLQLTDSASGTSSIYTASDISQHGHWSGWLSLDFNPSTSNYADIILCESAAGEAYRLRFGGNAQDRIELLHVKPGIETPLAYSFSGLLGNSSINTEWRVERFRDSAWIVDVNMDSLGWHTIINHPDTVVFASTFFGIECKYTKTRADKFYFDDISVIGQPYVDTIPPRIEEYQWINRKELTIALSEGCYADSATVKDQYGIQWELLFSSPSQVSIMREKPALDGRYVIDLSTIKDLEGNPLDTFEFHLSRPIPRGIQITEIMPDTDPYVEIQDEYVELMNTTSDTIALTGWSLHINQSKIALPDTVVSSGEYLLISGGPMANVIHVNRGNLLPNSSGEIDLRDDWEETIDWVAYESEWHSTSWKSDGGWSLEKDLHDPVCSQEMKWSSTSSSSGGTPGYANSPEENSTSILNEIRSIELLKDTLLISFSLTVTKALLCSELDTVVGLPCDFNSQMWKFSSPGSGLWSLTTEDCIGVKLDTGFIRLSELTGEIPQARITEISVNPLPNQPKFIELQNLSNNAFLLGDIRLGKWNSSDGIEGLYQLEPRNQLVLPGEVILVAEFQDGSVFETYPKSNTKSLLNSDLPFSLSSSGGLCITTKDGKTIDATEWNTDDYGDVTDRIGKCLMRKPTGSWTVSPARFNYGTPGWHDENTATISKLKFENLAFYTKDEVRPLKIHIPEDWTGSKVTIAIKNRLGITLGTWVDGELVQGSETLSWYGELEGKSLSTGQYLIELQKEDKDGYREVHHQGCLLIQK